MEPGAVGHGEPLVMVSRFRLRNPAANKPNKKTKNPSMIFKKWFYFVHSLSPT